MNIAEIAKLAGVSSAAVSRYFNHGYISEEKKAAIQKVVEETGDRPSVQAQTLRTKKTRMIGVVVPKIASTSIGRVVEGILSVVEKRSYQMLLAVTQNDPKKELEYLDVLDEKQVDGVILVGTVLTAEHKRMLKDLPVPAVVVGQQLSGRCCVYHDDYQATYAMTCHVLEKGRKRLGYIGAIMQDKAVGAERYRGFAEAVRGAGLEALAENHVTAAFTLASGYEKMEELSARCGPLDAVICATDTMAAGAIQYLREQGIKVPEQVLVTGQGDSEMAKMTAPPFPTVHYAYEKSGVLAAQMLMEALDKKDVELTEVKLGYRLVEG